MNDIPFARQENRSLATLAEMACPLLSNGKSASIAKNQNGRLAWPT
jgi:hypothetical protein